MVIHWRRRVDLVWRNKKLGFICGALFGIAFAVCASEVAASTELFGLLWKAFVGAVTIAVWFIRNTIIRITQKLEAHDAEFVKLAGVTEKMRRIEEDLRRLNEDHAAIRQIGDGLKDLRIDLKEVIDAWRDFQMSSVEWRAKVNEKLRINDKGS